MANLATEKRAEPSVSSSRSELNPLLCSKAFSKLRCGGEHDLSHDEIIFLRNEFKNLNFDLDTAADEIESMRKVAYQLTRIEIMK